MDKTPKLAGGRTKNQTINENPARPGLFERLGLHTPSLKLAEMTHRQRSRHEREQLYTRILLSAVGGIVVVVLALLGFGYWKEFVQPGQQTIVAVNGQQISTETYARIYGYEQTSLLAQYQRLQQDMQQLQAQGQGQDNSMLLSLLQQQQQQLQSQLQGLQQQVLTRIIEDTLINQEAAKRNITASDAEVNQELITMLSPAATPTDTVAAPGTTPEAAGTTTPQAAGTQTAGAAAPITQTPSAGTTPTAGAAATPTTGTTATQTPGAAAQTPNTASTTQTPAAGATPNGTTTPEASPTPSGPTPTPTPVAPQKLLSDFRSNLASIGLLSEADYINWYVRPEVLRKKLQAAFATQAPTSGDQVHASMIEVYSEDDAKSVQAKLKSGADFAQVAKESSQDTATKDKGGDLGWFPRGLQPEIPKVVEDAAFDKLKPGEVSDILSDNSTFYIVKLEEKAQNRPFDPATLKKVQDNMFNNWLKQQEANTGAGKTVSYYLGSDKDAWVSKFIQRNSKLPTQ